MPCEAPMLAMMDETSARMAWRRMRQFQSRIEKETTTNFLSAVGHEGVAGFYRLRKRGINGRNRRAKTELKKAEAKEERRRMKQRT